MIDTRPLWVRALSAHRSAQRWSDPPPLRLFGRSTKPLTNTQFVDLVRTLVGIGPLYTVRPRRLR